MYPFIIDGVFEMQASVRDLKDNLSKYLDSKYAAKLKQDDVKAAPAKNCDIYQKISPGSVHAGSVEVVLLIFHFHGREV